MLTILLLQLPFSPGELSNGDSNPGVPSYQHHQVNNDCSSEATLYRIIMI